ncbi:RloB family protein [Methylomonas rhizoryzae]|uniref:RloB family protein n=1 Tax=Methylomonas rhizoryzae TaxID=2608981 RepID=UPI00123193C0|nr:RloB family protein [Methylomonas rhizoryzae]
MSLIKDLKPRPLNRDIGTLRDDRLFIVASDDSYAPKQYFDFFRLARVQVHVVETPLDENRCHAIDVLQRLESIEHEEEDERWMLLDTDHYVSGPHIKEFRRIIKEAKEKGVSIALSKPCFELWLLLHHADKDTVSELDNAKEVEKSLRDRLGGYNKTRLKREHFPLEAVGRAYLQAKALDKTFKGGMIPLTNTSRVYQLWEAIIANSLPLQLPAELAPLRASNR